MPLILNINTIGLDHKIPKINFWNKNLFQINFITKKIIDQLEFYKEFPEKHIFFQCGDCEFTLPCLEKSIVFKESSFKESNDYCVFYSSNSLQDTTCDIKDCKYLVGFQGANNHPIRYKIKTLMDSIDRPKYYYQTKNFYHFLDKELKIDHLKTYQTMMNDCQFILCPRGVGLNSIRFFETIKAGRIPILIADQTKLPLEHIINYDYFVIRVPEKDILNTELYIDHFMANRDLQEVSMFCKMIYNKYFKDENVMNFISLSLAKNEINYYL